MAGGKLAGPHCLRVEVVGPDGRAMPHYAQNVLTREPVTTVSVDLALNDPAGGWRLRVRDVATGRSTAIPFTVQAER